VPQPSFSVVGLFAGIGGLELGLEQAGGRSELLCEWWEPAEAVLATHWPDTPLHRDVQTLRSIPRADVVTAGFPCQDLSQAGRTAGIGGKRSSLVGEVFRLIKRNKPRWLVLENVRNMLALEGGQAMRFLVDELESQGYRWAYRLVDSRSSGVAQRRQRVLMVASRTEDPAAVLLADDAGEPTSDWYRQDAYGFYWTEGLRGLGWAVDAVPTLKGGSTVGIPSPPAVWSPDAAPGHQIVLPTIEDAEFLQGFPRGWTATGHPHSRKNGPRWRLVGNAVTVGMSRWLGTRLAEPGEPLGGGRQFSSGRWPTAAWGGKGKAWASPLSMWPTAMAYRHLLDTLSLEQVTPLSARATAGFLSRTERSSLRFMPEFLVALKEHLRVIEDRGAA
jgi:DNA (cytosine-5)-methyltransferase 1